MADSNILIALMSLSDNVMAVTELLMDKGIFTIDELNAKLEEVHKVTGNTEHIEKIQMIDKINTILQQDTISADDRLYVTTNAPKIYSGEDLDKILTVVYMNKK